PYSQIRVRIPSMAPTMPTSSAPPMASDSTASRTMKIDVASTVLSAALNAGLPATTPLPTISLMKNPHTTPSMITVPMNVAGLVMPMSTELLFSEDSADTADAPLERWANGTKTLRDATVPATCAATPSATSASSLPASANPTATPTAMTPTTTAPT